MRGPRLPQIIITIQSSESYGEHDVLPYAVVSRFQTSDPSGYVPIIQIPRVSPDSSHEQVSHKSSLNHRLVPVVRQAEASRALLAVTSRSLLPLADSAMAD